jgi:cytochrome c5
VAGGREVKKYSIAILSVVFLGCSLQVLSQPQTPAVTKNSAKPTSTAGKKAGDEGEQRFQENCGRCHLPPESLSPREVKAVLQHMRVRANLSAEDEKLILKYLAP